MQQHGELSPEPTAGATEGPTRGERWRALPWRDLVALGGVMLLLTALSVYRLGELSLWRDEVSSVVFASAPLSELMKILGRERTEVGLANMATYYAILHFWLAVGETEARIRFLSVIAGVATLIPLWLIARRIGGWWAALFAALFFAGSRIVIQWNQEARGYSMAMLVAAGLTWLLIEAVERQRLRWWLAYGVIGALGLYVHFFVGFVVAAHGLWVLGTQSWPRHWTALVAVLLPLIVAGTPIPITALAQGTAIHWISPITIESAWGSLWRLAGTELLMAAVATLAVVAIVALRGPERRIVLLVLAGVLVPIVGAAVLSVIRPLFIPRYLVVVIPSMAILVGVGLAALRPVPLRTVVAVGVAVLLALNLPSAYRDRHQEDWRAASRWISREVRADDRIVLQDARRQITYYLTRFDTPVPEQTSVGRETEGSADARLWVVMRHPSRQDRLDLVDRLSPAYELVSDRRFGPRLRLLLLEPSAEAAADEEAAGP